MSISILGFTLVERSEVAKRRIVLELLLHEGPNLREKLSKAFSLLLALLKLIRKDPFAVLQQTNQLLVLAFQNSNLLGQSLLTLCLI